MIRHARPLLFPIMLVLYEIATYLSNDMYLPALPQIMRDLDLSDKQAQLTLTIWFLGSASMPLIMGAISDAYGRRFVLFGGGIIYITTTIICAMTHDEITFLSARFVQGGMVSTMMVSGYAAIHELYEQKEAIRILALMSIIVMIAPGLGPLFGAMVLYVISWRGIFWVIVVWASIAISALYYCMPETLPLDKRQVLSLQLIFKKYTRLLTNINFVLYMFILGFIMSGFLSWVTAGPLLVIENFHYSAMVFGVMQTVIFGANILGNASIKYLLKVLHVNSLINLGMCIILCGSLFMLVVMMYFPHTLFAFLAAMMTYSFGSGLCFAPLNRLGIETSDEPMGARVALSTVFVTSFAALGSGLSSCFFNGTITSLVWVIVAPSLIAFVLLRQIQHLRVNKV